MSVIVVWFRNGKLYKAKACGSRSWRRTANQWNEYAQLWNRRFEYKKNVVGIISEADADKLMRPHESLPEHAPPEVLRKKKEIRELMRVAPWGNWENYAASRVSHLQEGGLFAEMGSAGEGLRGGR